MDTYILGIDAGTSVIKSTLFDQAGHEVARAAVESPTQHPQSGWAELDMQQVWQAVVTSVNQVRTRAALSDPAAIQAIGITGQGDGTWLVNEQHQPIRSAILWSDGRCAAFVRDAHQSGLAAAIYQITGTMLNTSNMAAQLHWLAVNEPATLAKAHAALRAKDWIFLQMTGEIRTDESDASHTFFALTERAYTDEIWQRFDIAEWRHLRPPAYPSYENQAPLLPAVAAQLGFAPHTPVVAGPLDAVAVAVGVGAIAAGDACTSLGTAGIHQIVLDRPDATPDNVGYTICHAPANHWLRLLPTMACTPNLQWVVDQFFQPEIADAQQRGESYWPRMEAIAGAVPVGSNGVLFHPYIDPAGERAPFVRSEARAQFMGLDAGHSRADLLRAVYEGVLLSGLDCYAQLPLSVTELKLGGGGARSPLWGQMFADGLGAPVVIVEGEEFGAKGAAINAGVAVGIYDSFGAAVDQTVRPARRYEPDTDNHAIYRELLALYQTTYRALFPVWEARDALLARLQNNMETL